MREDGKVRNRRGTRMSRALIFQIGNLRALPCGARAGVGQVILGYGLPDPHLISDEIFSHLSQQPLSDAC